MTQYNTSLYRSGQNKTRRYDIIELDTQENNMIQHNNAKQDNTMQYDITQQEQ